MTVNYTTLLGLAKPVTGTEQGDWGDIVNDEITTLLEDAVANSAAFSVAAGDVTLSTTSGATNQARMSTLVISGSPGVSRNIIAPSQAKIYQVINGSNAAVVIKGAATTGVTIAAGATGTVAWNGSDFIEIGSTSSGRTFNGNVTVNGVITAQAAATQDAVKLQGRAGGSSSYAVTITPTTLTANRTITAPDTALTLAGIDVAQTFTAVQTFTPAARTSGAAPYFTLTTPADTGQTSSTESIGASFTAATRTWATGGLTLQRERVFGAPTYAFAGASTLTTAINVDIGTPVAGSNATITNAWALRSGPSLFVGNVRAEAAATQDAVVVAGRAGGTSSYAVTITPTTLAANRTFTLPDATTVAAGLAVSQTFTGIQTFTPDARTSGANPYFVVTMPTDTGQTAGTESIGVSYTAGTRTWAGGTLALQRERVFAAPTYAFGGVSTLTTAINVDIATPVAGTNATITNAYALRAGASLFTGTLTMDSTNAIDTTNLEVTNIKAKDGTAAMSIADSTGVVTFTKDEVVNGVTVGRGAGAVATNTAVGASALAANTTGVNNTAVGNQAGQLNTIGTDNVYVGSVAGYNAIGSSANVGVGSQALRNATGGNNTGIGYFSGTAITSGAFNTSLGAGSLFSNTTASNNTAVGYQAAYSNISGSRITALGYQSFYSNTTSSDNTAIGWFTLYSNSAGTFNTAVGGGDGATGSTLSNNTTGSYNTGLGFQALRSNTTASNNTAVGYQAGYSNTTGTGLAALGYQAGYTNNGNGNTAIGGGNIFIGAALYANSSGDNNVGIGSGALTANTVSNNTAVGYAAATANTTGTFNVAVGTDSLRSNTYASNNTAVGYQAARSNTTGTFNVAIGVTALIDNQTGVANTAVGSEAGYRNTGDHNTTLGYQAGKFTSSGSYNTALGSNALYSNTTASNNTAVGYQAGYTNTTGAITAIGYRAGYSNLSGYGLTAVGLDALRLSTGDRNTAMGIESLTATTSGTLNTAYGSASALSNTTGSYNTAIGASALYSNTTASNNTAVGYQAGYSNTTGTENFFGGYLAGAGLTAGRYSTLVGSRAGNASITGDGNTALGYYAYGSGSSGANNTALGVQTLYFNTTGSYNTAVGYQAGYNNQTSGGAVFLGYQAGYSSVGISTTINYNTAIGYQAGYALTSGYGNTLVGNSSGNAITTGYKNTIFGSYSGNQGGLDIRTSNNYIVLSDGDGNPREYISNLGTAAFTVDRTSSTNAISLVLRDNVTGGQTNGVYKSIRSESNAGSSVAEIRFIETDGSNNNTAIAFATAATAGGLSEKVRVLNTGAILAFSGATTNATGTGVGFPSTQSASTDPNVLDDYEEGTWGPVFAFSTSGSVTYGTQSGYYRKVGSLVFIEANVYFSAVSSPTGNVTINNLPFPVANLTENVPSFSFGIVRDLVNARPDLKAYGSVNTSNIIFSVNASNAGFSAFQGTDLQANTLIYLSGCYITT